MNFDMMRPSFAGGELAPTLCARVDLAKYHNGLRKLKNFTVLRHGGISNRPGTEFLGYTKYHDKKSILLPFKFSRDEAYMVEMGEGYFRFFTDGAQIVEGSSGNPYEVTNPYKVGDLPSVRLAQSLDTMFLACKDKAIMRLVRHGQTAWDCQEFPFERGPFLTGQSMENHLKVTTDQKVLVPGGTRTFNNGAFSFTVPANITRLDVVLEGGGFSTNQGNILPAPLRNPAEASRFGSFYAAGARAADKYGNLPHIAQEVLMVSSFEVTPGQVISGHAGKGGEPMPGNGWAWGKQGYVTVSWSQQLSEQVYGVLEAKLAMFKPEHVGGLFKIRQYIPSTSIQFPNSATVRVFSRWFLESSGYWAGTLRLERFNKISQTWEIIRTLTSSKDRNYSESGDVDEATEIRLVSSNFVPALPTGTSGDGYMLGKATLETLPTTYDGVVKVTEYVSPTKVKVKIQKEIGVENTWTDEWFEGAWSKLNGYPSCITFFQDRLVTGGTKNEPFAMFFSQPGDYGNYDTSLPLVDSDAIFQRVMSRENGRISSIVPVGDLLTLTSAGEFRVGPAGDGALSPTNFDALPQGNIGSANVNPVQVGNQIVYVQAGSSTVMDLGYSFEADGYSGSDLTVLASHLFQNHNIVSMAYQREPNSILWVVRDDGIALGLTYMKEQDIFAWHQHETAGAFEWVEVIPSEKGYDEVFFTVKRKINGQDVRCVERLKEWMPDNNLDEAFFVDCGLSYRGDPKTLIYKLDHLANMEVAILADGRVQERQKVREFTIKEKAPGQEIEVDKTVWGIELKKAASTVHVGLPYESEVETLSIEIPGGQTLQGKKKAIPRVTLRVDNTLGGYVSTGRHKDPLEWERLENPLGEKEKPYTGDKSVRPTDGYDEDGRITIKQKDPLPMTILGVIPDVVVGG